MSDGPKDNFTFDYLEDDEGNPLKVTPGETAVYLDSDGNRRTVIISGQGINDDGKTRIDFIPDPDDADPGA